MGRKAAIVASALTMGIALASTASAGRSSHGTFEDEGTEVVEGFCGVDGLTVERTFALEVRVLVVPHGPDGPAYFLQHGSRTEVITNTANGKRVTTSANVVEKDLLVTENADATLTILVLATGNAVVYGGDGKAIARNPGQIRFQLLEDEAGLHFVGVVKESTGRSDDFCDATVRALS